jgi:hypothetical protein
MRLRSRLAIVAITAALTAGMLTALGVAVPVSAATRAQVTPSTSDPKVFESEGNDGEFINGDTHGGDLYLSLNITAYTLINKGGGWYEISAGGYCWNSVPTVTSPVGEDSCQPTDKNEWFEFIPSSGIYDVILQYSSELYITAVDGKIDIDNGGGPQDNYEWLVANSEDFHRITS